MSAIALLAQLIEYHFSNVTVEGLSPSQGSNMDKELKLVTYNVDGLPDELDLSTLPWILRPIAWVYKLFKGTTIVRINDNSNTSDKTKSISERLLSLHPHIIGVQEDFNYHNELMSSLNGWYKDSTNTGEILLDKLFSRTEWLSCFPFPRFKCDGMNFISMNDNRVKVSDEELIRWKKSYGYFTHANDKLTHKGFRKYTVRLDDEVDIDVYIVHMDADFYDAETCPDVSKDIAARESELKQLTEYILDRYNSGRNVPSIIIGDTNSSPKYVWDVNNIDENLIKPINSHVELAISEAEPSNRLNVDRVFYINSLYSRFNISPKECYFDEGFNGLSDHLPLVATFNISKV